MDANLSLQRDFRMRQSESSTHLGLQFGKDGVAGVKKGKLILFKYL